MARRPKVVIIGGGIGGLAAGLAFLRRGIEVEIHEQAARQSEIGAGLNLSPNALKALRALGVEDEAIAIGFQNDCQVIRSWRSGRIISRQELAGDVSHRFGAAFITIHRADLLDILSRALPKHAVRLGASCASVEAGEGFAAARFSDGHAIEADVVIGADGIHSVVRESLFGRDLPRFTGCVCWRGLVPIEALADHPDAREMAA